MKIWDQIWSKNIFSKQNFQKTKILTLEFVYKMMYTVYEVDPTLQLGYLGVKKNFDFRKSWNCYPWTLFGWFSSKSCWRILDFPKKSEMCPTLRSCISEVNEYFFKIRKDSKKSMSKLSFEPNNTKNGHLGAKLEPIENWKFSKIRFHTPTCGEDV